MFIHFDIIEEHADLIEPMVAVRHHFRAWDAETEETLFSTGNSDPAGGLSGLTPTQAQLIFEIPVSEITVWKKEWDTPEQTIASIEGEGVCFFLPLEGHSAHYQVDVVYEPDAGIHYEATYVFDVEYPV